MASFRATTWPGTLLKLVSVSSLHSVSSINFKFLWPLDIFFFYYIVPTDFHIHIRAAKFIKGCQLDIVIVHFTPVACPFVLLTHYEFVVDFQNQVKIINKSAVEFYYCRFLQRKRDFKAKSATVDL